MYKRSNANIWEESAQQGADWTACSSHPLCGPSYPGRPLLAGPCQYLQEQGSHSRVSVTQPRINKVQEEGSKWTIVYKFRNCLLSTFVLDFLGGGMLAGKVMCECERKMTLQIKGGMNANQNNIQCKSTDKIVSCKRFHLKYTHFILLAEL